MTTRAGHDGVGTPGARALAVLPARLASTRLPRKMLLAETGTPLVVHAARNVLAAGVFARVVVAADAPEVVAAVRAAGLEAVATRPDHPSGSDRVHECWRALADAGERADVIVNVQGDEPELPHADLRALVGAFTDRTVELATLAVPIGDEAEFANPNVVKVVCDARGDALYFSRAPIPHRGHATADPRGSPPLARRHVGVYAFAPRALERFCGLSRGRLEAEESLEQLRWLEHGGKLRVVTATRAPRGIDTREDYDAFVARVRAGEGTRASEGRGASGGRARGEVTERGARAG